MYVKDINIVVVGAVDTVCRDSKDLWLEIKYKKGFSVEQLKLNIYFHFVAAVLLCNSFAGKKQKDKFTVLCIRVYRKGVKGSERKHLRKIKSGQLKLYCVVCELLTVR